jgi:hypothetical protein
MNVSIDCLTKHQLNKDLPNVYYMREVIELYWRVVWGCNIGVDISTKDKPRPQSLQHQTRASQSTCSVAVYERLQARLLERPPPFRCVL